VIDQVVAGYTALLPLAILPCCHPLHCFLPPLGVESCQSI
jgi:hypothetical protein